MLKQEKIYTLICYSTTLAALDAESDFLTDEIDFTFEGWKLTTPFTELPGMRQ